MHHRIYKEADCSKCNFGFVEPLQENWELIGLIERYQFDSFVDVTNNQGCRSINTNVGSISHILKAEGYEGKEYTIMLNKLMIFCLAAINRIYKTDAIIAERQSKVMRIRK